MGLRVDIGRRAFGAAAFTFGVVALTSRDFAAWQQVQALGDTLIARGVWYVAAIIEITCGVAMQRRATARAAAMLLGATLLLFALLALSSPVRAPAVYNNWNSVFEQLSMATGALMIAVSLASGTAPATRRARAVRIGTVVFGLCVASFALEQAVYMRATAALVPRWMPPGAEFWAVATTVALGLAALALVMGRAVAPAARLLALMLLAFGVLIWIPAIVANAGDRSAWNEGAETLAIAAAAWVIANAWSVAPAPRSWL